MTLDRTSRRDVFLRLLASCVVSILLAALVAAGCGDGGDAGEGGRFVRCYGWVQAAGGATCPNQAYTFDPNVGASCGVTQTVDLCCYDIGGCVFGVPGGEPPDARTASLAAPTR